MGRSEGSDDKNDQGQKDSVKRKRRSKNDASGRSYTCELCQKSYLSIPALTNHKKTKHLDEEANSQKRGRGRPRKNINAGPSVPESAEQKYNEYFYKESRRYLNEGVLNIKDFVTAVFEDIFIKNKDKFKSSINYTREDHHPFFALILSKTNDVELKQVEESKEESKEKMAEANKTCDEAFYEFLNICKSKTNQEYFKFIFKFVVLFRECINVYKNVELETNREVLKENIPDNMKEYTQYYNAETVPDLCNEFVTEFMDRADYFNMNSDTEKFELIEIIQYFCHWLHEYGYTSSKLSLLN